MDEKLQNELLEFPVTLYGDFSKYNDVTSRCRVRIFYKYENRNHTYITDEFAEKLIASLPYTPIKGIYDNEDYTDHGGSRSLGRIYGIVPENPNIAWENHVDEDGVERTYACADVLIFTALYSEASDIIGKGQSMELYSDSIVGEWQYLHGQKYYVFSEGCFLGLQVLGNKVEPCFEGAAFFNLSATDDINAILQRINEYNLNLQIKERGGQTMPKFTFKLSDDQKFSMLWDLLNPTSNEDSWEVTNIITAVYDEYCIVYALESDEYRRVYYTKSDENDSIVLGESERCFIVDVNEAEKATLAALHAINNTYEKLDETFEQMTNENSELAQKNEELVATNATLIQSKDELQAQVETANEILNDTKATLENVQVELANLQAQNEELITYKQSVELSEKEAVIDSYKALLSSEILDSYKAEIDKYTADELDMRLAYELKKNNPSVFTHKDGTNLIPKINSHKSGIEGLLEKYKK